MKQLLSIMKDLLLNGDEKTDRTNTGTISKFGGVMKFSLQHGFWPVVTTRELDYRKIAQELEWMIKGIVDVSWLNDRNNNIWNSWIGTNGTIGPMYGEQWRNWSAHSQPLTPAEKEKLEFIQLNVLKENQYIHPPEVLLKLLNRETEIFYMNRNRLYQHGGRAGVDQLQYVINELKDNPDSRRMCVNVWHAGLLPDSNISPNRNVDNGKMALAPCHSMWQVYTAPMSDFEIMMYAMELESEAYLNKIKEIIDNSKGDSMRTSTEIMLESRSLLVHYGLLKINQNQHFEATEKGTALLNLVYENGFTNGRKPRKLSLACFARSQDIPLGTVWNVGMYSLLTHLLAEITNMVPWEYTHFMGDYHIYQNQIDCVMEQLEREPKPHPRIIVDPSLKRIDDFTADRFKVWYDAHPKIVFPKAAV